MFDRRIYKVGPASIPMTYMPPGSFLQDYVSVKSLGYGSDEDEEEESIIEETKKRIKITYGFWISDRLLDGHLMWALGFTDFLSFSSKALKYAIPWAHAALITNKLSREFNKEEAFVISGFNALIPRDEVYAPSEEHRIGPVLVGIGNGTTDYVQSSGFRLPTLGELQYYLNTYDSLYRLDKFKREAGTFRKNRSSIHMTITPPREFVRDAIWCYDDYSSLHAWDGENRRDFIDPIDCKYSQNKLNDPKTTIRVHNTSPHSTALETVSKIAAGHVAQPTTGCITESWCRRTVCVAKIHFDPHPMWSNNQHRGVFNDCGCPTDLIKLLAFGPNINNVRLVITDKP